MIKRQRRDERSRNIMGLEEPEADEDVSLTFCTIQQVLIET